MKRTLVSRRVQSHITVPTSFSNLRMIELTASTVHQVAVLLIQVDLLYFPCSSDLTMASHELNAHIHSRRVLVAHRMCQILDEQRAKLSNFQNDTKRQTGIKERSRHLFNLLSPDNRTRVYRDMDIPMHNAYRDLWGKRLRLRRLHMYQDLDMDNLCCQ